MWLVLDLVAWLPFDYRIISFAWSLFDYLNVVFFLFGLYFFIVFINKRDIHWKWRLFGILLTIFPLYSIFSGNSIQLFNQQACEAFNNPLVDMYKTYIEIFVIFVLQNQETLRSQHYIRALVKLCLSLHVS